jgi:hypothetical protein
VVFTSNYLSPTGHDTQAALLFAAGTFQIEPI